MLLFLSKGLFLFISIISDYIQFAYTGTEHLFDNFEKCNAMSLLLQRGNTHILKLVEIPFFRKKRNYSYG